MARLRSAVRGGGARRAGVVACGSGGSSRHTCTAATCSLAEGLLRRGGRRLRRAFCVRQLPRRADVRRRRRRERVRRAGLPAGHLPGARHELRRGRRRLRRPRSSAGAARGADMRRGRRRQRVRHAAGGLRATTCAAEGKSCGTIPDGCGGHLDCGACGKDQVCSAANACVQAPCTATTCKAQGKDCGRIPDGCGGDLECGSCAEGQTCGGGGNQNVCGAPSPSRTGSLVRAARHGRPRLDRRRRRRRRRARRAPLAPRGDEASSGGTLRLEKRDRSGKKPVDAAPGTYKGWRGVPAGGDPARQRAPRRRRSVLVRLRTATARSVDLGGGPILDSALAKLGPDGRFVWQVSLTGRGIGALAADDAGRRSSRARRRNVRRGQSRSTAGTGSCSGRRTPGVARRPPRSRPPASAYLAGRSPESAGEGRAHPVHQLDHAES